MLLNNKDTQWIRLNSNEAEIYQGFNLMVEVIPTSEVISKLKEKEQHIVEQEKVIQHLKSVLAAKSLLEEGDNGVDIDIPSGNPSERVLNLKKILNRIKK